MPNLSELMKKKSIEPTNVGFKVKPIFWEVGEPDFLAQFFASITEYLEPSGHGTKFPLMAKLYQGKLSADETALALEELNRIKASIKPVNKTEAAGFDYIATKLHEALEFASNKQRELTITSNSKLLNK
jgi:lysyl-tRNA synthetase class I